MRFTIFLSTLTLLFSSAVMAENVPCGYKFLGFFETELAPTVLDAETLLNDIAEATSIHPRSPMALQGFSGVGKCLNLNLANASATAKLMQMNFNIAVLALKGERSGTYYISSGSYDELVGDECVAFHGKNRAQALERIQSSNYLGGFSGKQYSQNYADTLAPVQRELRLTKDQRFLLSIRYLWKKKVEGTENTIHHVCAYPVN